MKHLPKRENTAVLSKFFKTLNLRMSLRNRWVGKKDGIDIFEEHFVPVDHSLLTMNESNDVLSSIQIGIISIFCILGFFWAWAY